ncbi:hypothetical protein DLJ46_18670 [Micromonospora globispora]|uniref:Uncharacterized protein n=1 Tax=Micromonospora globispora TaxID=1450148 RepID=A0A317K0Z8_9ACTN|nr:hypothetical protein DLJ46_18670 [Micromonospora globispora]RQW93044.1 hypothetical protein DKL51_18015 [Micromonospora globispora]
MGAAHLHRESGQSRTDLFPGVNTVVRCVDTGEQARSTMCGLTAEMGFRQRSGTWQGGVVP